MNNKFFYYALFVTLVTTFGSWASMLQGAGTEGGHGGGSSWSSRTGSYGGGGGGHK